MPRYAAFLRGVGPMNAKMPELRKAFESAGFSDVKTVLGSGNVAFSARSAPATALQQLAEAAMKRRLGDAFLTIVRSMDGLGAMLASDPDRKSTRLNSSHGYISYAVFCLKKKKKTSY